ncbi:MAG: RidA family protein [Nitrospirota bacterium]
MKTLLDMGKSNYSRDHASFHVSDAGGNQMFLVACPPRDETVQRASLSVYRQIAEILIDREMEIVHERIFGTLSAESMVMEARNESLHGCLYPGDSPVTYVEGNPPWGDGLAGVIIRAVPAEDVWTIRDSRMPYGRGWRLDGVTYLALQNIQGMYAGGEGAVKSSLSGVARPLQTRLMLERAERILRENGASYKDVVRTWFYVSDILGWYAAFNKARNEKYGEFGIMPGPGDRELLLPASTGIQGVTQSGAACAMDLIAVLNSENCTRKLSNPSQLDAFRYGSAFSRASVVRNGSADFIEVSGTAAIDEHGVSLYPGNIRAQIDCTFDKVQTLLAQEGAELKDICSATVFVKQSGFAEIFYEMAAARGLEDLPCVCVVADVCREELLFEMDAEAVVKPGTKVQGAGNSSE